MAIDLQKNADAQFDVARKRAANQEAANLQGQKDALARRAAQLGGGPSGAFVKQEQVASNQSAERLGQANEGIDAAQQAETRRIGEVLQGQEFARGERVGSQDFAAGQAAIQRKYGTTEREASQGYATGERVASQGYATGEREASQAYATGERQAGQTFQAGESQKAIDAAFKQQEMAIKAAAAEGALNRDQEAQKLAELKRQYDEDTKVNEKVNAISTILSGHNSGLSPGAVGDLLTSLGIDVTAIPGLSAPVPQVAPKPPSAPKPKTPIMSGGTRSDRRLKKSIEPFTAALETLEDLQVHSYRWKDTDEPEVGFLAQELQEVWPSAVSGSPTDDPETNPMRVDYGRLTPLLVAALQEAVGKIQSLEQRLTTLEETHGATTSAADRTRYHNAG